ncbi:MAG: flagellar biosynthesis anti-sigma factor FlgM [Planctomycetes bacterium]|nr:flagellar biosynthesis anti-sigma factor FlgM [Planctomycetota bacterium]
MFLLDPKDRALIEAAAAGLDDVDEEVLHGRFLEVARRLPKVRLEKVMKLREEIAAGTYVTEEKLQATVDRLLAAFRGA